MTVLNTNDEIRLERIEKMLRQRIDQATIKSHYTVEEFGSLVKRAPFTVRQWCNEGRIKSTGELGFEPRQSAPEALVLPLHHSPN